MADFSPNAWLDLNFRNRTSAGMGGAAIVVLAVLIWALLADVSGGMGDGGGSGGGSGDGIGAGTGSGSADAGTGPGAGATGTGRAAITEGTAAVALGAPDAAPDPTNAVSPNTAPPAPPATVSGRSAPRVGHTVPEQKQEVATAPPPPTPPIQRGDPSGGKASGGAAGAGGGGGGGSAVEFMGVKTTATNVVYILDHSGSMLADNRLYHTYLELRKSVMALGPKCTFSFVYFDHDFLPLPEPGKMHRAIDAEKKKTLEWAEKVIPEGATDPSHALRFVLENMDCDTIFLMTDGEFDAQATFDVINRLNQKRSVAIHTIAFHSQMGEPVLKQIARENNGEYRFVPPPGGASSQPSIPTLPNIPGLPQLPGIP